MRERERKKMRERARNTTMESAAPAVCLSEWVGEHSNVMQCRDHCYCPCLHLFLSIRAEIFRTPLHKYLPQHNLSAPAPGNFWESSGVIGHCLLLSIVFPSASLRMQTVRCGEEGCFSLVVYHSSGGFCSILNEGCSRCIGLVCFHGGSHYHYYQYAANVRHAHVFQVVLL